MISHHPPTPSPPTSARAVRPRAATPTADPTTIAPAALDDRDRRLLTLLRGMYPLWRVTCRIDRHGHRWWWALRVLPLTSPQYAAGLLTWFARPTLTRVAAELHHQHAIAHHRRL